MIWSLRELSKIASKACQEMSGEEKKKEPKSPSARGENMARVELIYHLYIQLYLSACPVEARPKADRGLVSGLIKRPSWS